MSSIFLTGGTGYLGSYVCDTLLKNPDNELFLLVRAKDEDQAIQKLWNAWQLHIHADDFYTALERVTFIRGDLHAPDLGISPADQRLLLDRVDSILHIAASLNRKSSKACFNTNLRGTLSLLKLARRLHDHNGLERFSHVSTVAVAGQRDREVVQEDDAIDWNRSDYDPYGRTKKFCEHMVRELLPDVPKTFFRPSIVMGDSRFEETSQFDMVRAFCTIADLPVIPLDPNVRLDIVNADYVGRAIATIHTKAKPKYDIYHLSSGTHSRTAKEIADALVSKTGRTARFSHRMEPVFDGSIRLMNRLPRKNPLAQMGALLKVFLPYITYDTVFANDRVIEEMGGEAPTPFPEYCANLYQWSKGQSFRYPHLPLPERVK